VSDPADAIPDPYRWIRSGDAAELVPLSAATQRVIVETELDASTWQRVADLLEPRPDVELSIQRGADLEMLRWFPALTRLDVGSLRLRTLEGIGHVHGSIERLTLGDTLRPVSMAPLAGAPRLERLGVNGSWRHPETLATLTSLRRLGIGSVEVEWLLPMRRLERFTSGLGTIRGIERLPEVGRLESIELYRLRGPHDLAVLAHIPTLQTLDLASTRAIERLPSFAESRSLTWVALGSMRGITDLRPLAAAPSLQVLLLVDMPQLAIDDLRPLVGHPTLRAGIWGLGSLRKNAEAAALLPLPPANGEPPPWDDPDRSGIRHPAAT
jgi:hypothetical protein